MPPSVNPSGNILVVDDDPGSRHLLASLLGDAGYHVNTAANGEQGLLSAAQHAPDLIVLDVRMPGMNGFDISRALQRSASTATIPVIFLSAAADPVDRIQGFDAGGVDFIAKPFVDDEVLARVKTHITMALAAKNLLRRRASTASAPGKVAEAKDGAARRPEILVVEDTPESLRLLSTVLTEAGFAVREAPNGELALWTATRHPPDLILLDIRMPGMTGFDVCRCLKNEPATARVPVIFLSALSDREDKAEGFAAGAVDYLTKPFSEMEVLTRVRTHLRFAESVRSIDDLRVKISNPEGRPPRIDFEAGIRNALANGELELLYQPIIEVASTRLVGAEALLRWHVPGLGTLEPADFLSIAEETGAVVPIGDWAVGAACAQLHRWQPDLPADFRLTVNLCSLQFWQDGLVRCIERALTGASVPPAMLEFDIRESTLYEDLEQAIANLHRLKALGVGLSVDDFGAGDTRLTALRRLPVDRLKISRALMVEPPPESQLVVDTSVTTAHDLPPIERASPTSIPLLGAIVALAHKLQWQALVKGVENADQLASLQSCACDLAQGYLTARPVSADTFYNKFLKDHGRHLLPTT